MHYSSQVHETLMQKFFVLSKFIQLVELYFTKCVEILQVFQYSGLYSSCLHYQYYTSQYPLWHYESYRHHDLLHLLIVSISTFISLPILHIQSDQLQGASLLFKLQQIPNSQLCDLHSLSQLQKTSGHLL
ncbi:hypothetical protein FGO68_gene8707 [Halteria grandinella]|uniref:Uncharacterized protein n=1 Tax=Halteria grandinella TaxID=5974 RepID=A0A8J8NEC4_HALGN|nr:hypothetical protein FGO68_gene8707 [Halteria grandinella]